MTLSKKRTLSLLILLFHTLLLLVFVHALDDSWPNTNFILFKIALNALAVLCLCLLFSIYKEEARLFFKKQKAQIKKQGSNKIEVEKHPVKVLGFKKTSALGSFLHQVLGKKTFQGVVLSLLVLNFSLAALFPLFQIQKMIHMHNAALGILETGTPKMPSGVIYIRALPYIYLLAAFYKVLGVSALAARLSSVLVGALCIPLAYFLIKKLTNKWVGLFSAGLFSFSGWFIAVSQERFYSLHIFFILASTLTFLNLDTEKKSKKILLTILFLSFSSLTFLTHQTGLILIFLPLLSVLLNYQGDNKFLSSKNKYLLGLMATLAVQGLAIYQINNIRCLTPSDITFTKVKNIVGIGLHPFWLETLSSWFPLYFFVFFAGLLLAALKNSRKKMFVYLFFLFSFYSLSCFYFRSHIPEFLFFIIPLFYSSCAIALCDIFLFFYLINKNNSNPVLKIVTAAFIFLIGFSIVQPWSYSFEITKMYDDNIPEINLYTNARYWIYDAESPSKYVLQNLQENDIVIAVGPHDNIYLKNHLDYFLITHKDYLIETGVFYKNHREWEYLYTRTPIITSLEGLKYLIKNNPDKNIWIVLNSNLEGRLDDGSLEYIENNFELSYRGKSRNSKVYLMKKDYP